MRFGDAKIEKKECHSSKNSVDLRDIDIKKILVSNEFAYDKIKETESKYFTWYKMGKKIRPLFITVPQMSRYLNKVKKKKQKKKKKQEQKQTKENSTYPL